MQKSVEGSGDFINWFFRECQKAKRGEEHYSYYEVPATTNPFMDPILREWVEKNVGIRAARLVEDSETMARTEFSKVDEIFDGEDFTKFSE